MSTLPLGMLLVATVASCSNCGRTPAPGPPSAYTDAGLDDGEPTLEPLCLERSLPPQELDDVQPTASDLVWNGHDWGAVWSEGTPVGDGIRFVRIGSNGTLKPPSVLLTDTSYRGIRPRVIWYHDQFWVVYEGGATDRPEIWFSRVDLNGSRVGNSERWPPHERQDHDPFLLSIDSGLLLGWTSVVPDVQNNVLFASAVSTRGTPSADLIWLDQRHIRTRSPRWVETPTSHAVVWSVAQRDGDLLGLDLARYTPSFELRGNILRVTPAEVGGGDDPERFSFVWDGENYFVAWDELHAGLSHVMLRRISPRGQMETPVGLSPPGESARHPSLEVIRPGVLAVAWETERRTGPRMRITTIDRWGRWRGEGISVQDREGISGTPVMEASPNALGILSSSPTGIRFHLAPFAPCHEILPDPVETDGEAPHASPHR